MGLTWNEVEASAQDRQTWRQRVALCIGDAGWIKSSHRQLRLGAACVRCLLQAGQPHQFSRVFVNRLRLRTRLRWSVNEGASERVNEWMNEWIMRINFSGVDRRWKSRQHDSGSWLIFVAADACMFFLLPVGCVDAVSPTSIHRPSASVLMRSRAANHKDRLWHTVLIALLDEINDDVRV